jgi:hypothetical protein
VQSRKTKREPNITEAAERTGLLIRGLQSRLLEGGGEVVQEQPGDTAANLEKQLQEYFACYPAEDSPESGALNRIRHRVIDGVVERILRGWQEDGKAHQFENEVIERLVDGVLDMVIAGRAPRAPKPATTQ